MLTKFKLFEAYNPNEIVLLKNSKKQIILKIERVELSRLNSLIINFLNTYYRKYGYSYGKNNKTINVNGIFLETEYLDKFVNNITLFGKIASRNKLKTNDEFISYIRVNLRKLYGSDGDEFLLNYKIIENTAKKGKRGEDACKRNFEKLLHKKTGSIITIEDAAGASEDLGGIDGKFIFKGKLVTLQIKPFFKYEIDDEIIRVYSNGSMGFNTHYLLLYKEYYIGRNEMNEPIYKYDFISLKNGEKFNKISSNNGIYETNKENIIDISFGNEILKYNL